MLAEKRLASKLAALFMIVTLATSSAACTSSMWGQVGRTYRLGGVPQGAGVWAVQPDAPAPVIGGEIPLAIILQHLKTSGALTNWPPIDPDHPAIFNIAKGSRLADLVFGVERQTGWIYDPASRSFQTAYATSTVDSPDHAGRVSSTDRLDLKVRRMIAVAVAIGDIRSDLFVTRWSDLTAGVGASARMWRFSTPAGVRGEWNSGEERGYSEGVVLQGNNAAVATTRSTAQSGFIVRGLASALPGGWARADLELELSAFTSSTGLDRRVITMPMQLDLPAGIFVRVGAIDSASIDLRGGPFRLDLTGAQATIWLRID